MAIRRIFTDDSACLYKVSRQVDKFDSRLSTLIDDMTDTLYDADGAGLAAPQIGILKRVVVIDCGDGLVELVNPEVIEVSGEQGGMEGCLSFPGKTGYVVRPNLVKVRGKDRHGKEVEYTGEGLFARAIMHECDHLDGKVYLRLVTQPPEGFDSGNDEKEDGE